MWPVARIIVVLAFVSLLYWPYIPASDNGRHIYEAFLINAYLDGEAIPYRWAPYIPPNLAFQLLVAGVSFVLDPTTAGNLVFVGILVSLFLALSAWMKARSPSGDRSVDLAIIALSAVFTLNFNAVQGNNNYLLALAVLFFATRSRDACLRRGVAQNMLVYLVLYMTHFMGFLLYGMYTLVCAALAPGTGRTMASRVSPAVIGALPFALLFGHYLWVRDVGALQFPAMPVADYLYDRAIMLYMTLNPLVVMRAFGPEFLNTGMSKSALLVSSALIWVSVMLSFGYALSRGRFVADHKAEFSVLFALVLLFLVTPITVAGVARLPERYLLFGAALAVASGIDHIPALIRRVMTLCLAVIFFLNLGSYVASTDFYATGVRALERGESFPAFDGRTNGAIVFAEYLVDARNKRIVRRPLFGTGLLLGPE